MYSEPRIATRSGTIAAIAGTVQTRAPCLILLAALWNDDLAPQFAGRVRGRLFTDDLLRAIAAFSVGNLSTFGVNDLRTVERMLRERFASQAVTITIETIRKLVDLIEVDDVADAIDILNRRARSAA